MTPQSLDQQIEAAYAEAERIEANARQLEARILATGARLPTRQYGKPVDASELAKNLTARSLICKRDPRLAAYLGLQDGSYRRDAEEREAAALRAEAMRQRTERLREVNAASARYREQMNLQGINPNTGRRW